MSSKSKYKIDLNKKTHKYDFFNRVDKEWILIDSFDHKQEAIDAMKDMVKNTTKVN